MSIDAATATITSPLDVVTAFKTAKCDAEASAMIRSALRCVSQEEALKKRRELEEEHIHRFVFQQFSSNGRSEQRPTAELLRFLRDLTCTSALQAQARDERTLDWACDLVTNEGSRLPADVLKAAVEFVANCCSGPSKQTSLNRNLVWTYMEGCMGLWFQANEKASAMLVYVIHAVSDPDNNNVERDRCDHLKQLATTPTDLNIVLNCFGESQDPDTRIWLAWTFASILRDINPELYFAQLTEEHLGRLVEDGNVLDETQADKPFPIRFVIYVISASFVDMRIRMEVLTKLARWTAENPIEDVVEGESVISVAVKLIANAKKANEEDLCTDLLRVIANTLHGGDESLRDHLRRVGGVHLLLNNTYLDPRYPSRREWALFAIREACAGNEETQRLIETLKPVSLDTQSSQSSNEQGNNNAMRGE